MRTIVDDGGSFTTHGNSNGVYDQMQKNVKQESRERFNRKPWYLECMGRKKAIPTEGVVSINKEMTEP